jgi:hypothetical protein
MLQPSAEPCNLRGRAARTILGLAGSLESYGVVFMLITRKHGIPTLSGLLDHRLLAWRLSCTECVC